MTKEVQINGSKLFYHPDTDPRVVDICERYNRNWRHNWRDSRYAQRLIFLFGDVKTGEPWGDPPQHYGATDTGYVGNSTGPSKIPIAVYNTRCYGGGAILTHCVVKIMTARGKRTLYDITQQSA